MFLGIINFSEAGDFSKALVKRQSYGGREQVLWQLSEDDLQMLKKLEKLTSVVKSLGKMGHCRYCNAKFTCNSCIQGSL